MGLKPAPNIAQEYIKKTIGDLKDEGVEVYIDDVGLFFNTYEEHVSLITKVVQRLQMLIHSNASGVFRKQFSLDIG